MVDHLLLGDISNNDELMEYLEEYDTDWYIGQESDPEWSKAVISNTPRLFSLGRNLQQVNTTHPGCSLWYAIYSR